MTLADQPLATRDCTCDAPSPRGFPSLVTKVVLTADATLNRERLTHYPLILLVMACVIYAIGIVLGDLPFDATGKPIAVDLSAYVTGARIVLDGDVDLLYSLPHQWTVQQSILGNSPDYLNMFIAPPFVAYAYAPFVALPYSFAALAWSVLSFGVLALSIRLVWTLVPNLHSFTFPRVVIIVLASAPAFELLGGGQNSAISLLLMCGGLRLLLLGRTCAAGGVLGLGIFKPQLFVLMPVLLFLERRWVALTAWITTVGSLTALSLGIVGINGVRDYVALLTSSAYQEQLLGELGWKMATVGSLLRSVFPENLTSEAVTTTMNLGILVTGGVLLWMIRRRIQENFHGSEALTLSYATSVLIAATFAPHAFIYDSVLLVLPLMIFLNMFHQSPALRVTVAGAYILAWSAPVRAVALDGTNWPASILMGPWTIAPILACLVIVYRNMDGPQPRNARSIDIQTMTAPSTG